MLSRKRGDGSPVKSIQFARVWDFALLNCPALHSKTVPLGRVWPLTCGRPVHSIDIRTSRALPHSLLVVAMRKCPGRAYIQTDHSEYYIRDISSVQLYVPSATSLSAQTSDSTYTQPPKVGHLRSYCGFGTLHRAAEREAAQLLDMSRSVGLHTTQVPGCLADTAVIMDPTRNLLVIGCRIRLQPIVT